MQVKEQAPSMKEKTLLKKCVSSVELVCGIPGRFLCTEQIFSSNIVMHTGDGKTHYILERLQKTCSAYVIIPIHEGFSYQRVIERLHTLPLTSDTNPMVKMVHGVFFNFTMCYQKVMC